MIVEYGEFLAPDSPTAKFKAWQVLLDKAVIDIVLYPDNLSQQQVRRKLVIEDGYPNEITVMEGV